MPPDLHFPSGHHPGGSPKAHRPARALAGVSLWVLVACGLLAPAARAAEASGGPDDCKTARRCLSDLSLEQLMEIEVVYGASRFEQKVSDAPASVTIITAEEIEAYGYRTLADVLQSVRGFYSTYDHSYQYIATRGYGVPGDYNSRVLLLVDGHRMNDNIYDQAPVGTQFPVELSMIDRIEVIRGPSSSVYGSSAFFAVFNVVTKDGSDHQGARVAAEVGSAGTYYAPLSVGGVLRSGFEYMVGGSRYHHEGLNQFPLPLWEEEAGTFNGEESDRDLVVRSFASLRYGPARLRAGWSQRDKQLPPGAYATDPIDGRSRLNESRSYADLSLAVIPARNLELTGRLGYDTYALDGHFASDVSEDGDPLIIVQEDVTRGRRFSTGTQLSHRWGPNHLLAGADYQRDVQQDLTIYWNVYSWPTLEDGWQWGVYVQDEVKVLPRVTLNAGVRHDRHDTFGKTTNPRLALVASPLKLTRVKVLYGTAFRAPNAFENFYYGRPDSVPELGPEEIRTLEGVIEQYVSADLYFTLSVFRYKTWDLIALDGTPMSPSVWFTNRGEAEAQGVEAELRGRIFRDLQFNANYSYTKSEDPGTGAQPANSPDHLANLNLRTSLFQHFLRAGLRLQYMGERRTLEGARLEPLFLTHLTLRKPRVVGSMDLSLSIYNVFDVDYGDPGSAEHTTDVFPQDGRSFRVGLSYQFD